MIKGYEYQSDFARKYYGQGKAEGREEARAALRREIVALVGARLPGLRDELASRLREQPEAVLVRVTAELGQARDEKRARAILDLRVERMEAVADRAGRRVAAVGVEHVVDQARERRVGRAGRARRRRGGGRRRRAAASTEDRDEDCCKAKHGGSLARFDPGSQNHVT